MLINPTSQGALAPPPPPPEAAGGVPPPPEDEELELLLLLLLEEEDEEPPEELELLLLLEPVNVTIEYAGTAYVNAPLLTATSVWSSSVCVADVTTGVTDESVRPWRLNVWLTARVVLFAATIAKRPPA